MAANESSVQPSPIQLKSEEWRRGCESMRDPQKAEAVFQDMTQGFRTFSTIDRRLLVKAGNRGVLPRQEFVFITWDLIKQFEDHRIVKVEFEPAGIWPIFLVPKDDTFRAVRNFSAERKGLYSLNQGISDDASRVRFPLLTDICRLAKKVGPNGFIFCLDGKHYYRQFSMHPDDQIKLGYQWMDTNIIDTRAPEGVATLPFNVQRASEAVIEISDNNLSQTESHLRGLTKPYIDDFIGMASTELDAWRLTLHLLQTFESLGILVNVKKVKLPARIQKVLGFVFDLVLQQVYVEQEAKEKMMERLRLLILNPRLSRKELEKLVGKLCWFSRVIFPARTFLRRIYTRMWQMENETKVQTLHQDIISDLSWWHMYFEKLNGVSFDRVLNVKKRNAIKILSDASDWGIGAWNSRSWFSCSYEQIPLWFRSISAMHIGVREMFAVAVAVATWAPFWTGKQIQFWCDNYEVVWALQKMTSTDLLLMPFVRYIAMMAIRYQFTFQIEWISTNANHLADDLSRDRIDSFCDKFHRHQMRDKQTPPQFGEFYEFE